MTQSDNVMQLMLPRNHTLPFMHADSQRHDLYVDQASGHEIIILSGRQRLSGHRQLGDRVIHCTNDESVNESFLDPCSRGALLRLRLRTGSVGVDALHSECR
jgi:hypothetical protein